MPIVHVEFLAGRSPALKQALAAELTEVMARHCGADPAHIWVLFKDVAHSDWAVAGRLFSEPPASAVKAARPAAKIARAGKAVQAAKPAKTTSAPSTSTVKATRQAKPAARSSRA